MNQKNQWKNELFKYTEKIKINERKEKKKEKKKNVFTIKTINLNGTQQNHKREKSSSL